MWVTIGSGEGEGLSVKVEGERFLIGSGEESQLMVRGAGIEPLHAYFQVREDGVVELHPLEGETHVNGQRVAGPVRITGGEEIRVGETLLRPTVDDPAEEASAVQDADDGVADPGTVTPSRTPTTAWPTPGRSCASRRRASPSRSSPRASAGASRG